MRGLVQSQVARIILCAGLLLFLVLVVLPLGSKGNLGHVALRNVCLRNVKVMGLGCLMYSEDYDNRFPLTARWMDDLQGYVKSEATLHCPSFSHPLGNSKEALAKVPYGYAMNRFLSGSNAVKLAEPHEKPLIYESIELGRDVSGFLTDVPNPGRHGGSNEFAFADGHARSMKGS